MAQATAPILDSTKAAVRCDAKNRRVLKVNRTAFRRLVPLPTSTPSRSRRLYREKVLDRRSSRQAPDLDKHLHLTLRETALVIGERKLHTWIACRR